VSRVQLALNVDDLEQAVTCYSKLFGAEPAKRKPGYANFARLSGEGLFTDEEMGTTCCFATQDKVWVTGPGGERWEVYTVLADSATFGAGPTPLVEAGQAPSGGCCASVPDGDAAACC